MGIGATAFAVLAGPGVGRRAIGFVVGAAAVALAVALEVGARRVPIDRLFWGATGGLIGLLGGLAAGLTLVPLAGVAGAGAAGLLGACLGASVALARQSDLAGLSSRLFPGVARAAGPLTLIDTSVLIDGRIVEVCATGFVGGALVIPKFVLAELQRVADAGDPSRRARGKRGFEMVQSLQKLPGARVEVIDRDVPDVPAVDEKLVVLARTLNARIATNDTALQALAEVRGVTALNLNALASALRPAVVPGETMQIQILREGREPGQGVGFLDDGTMVVVDQGKRHVGRTIEITVTNVRQTSAGRMIFGRGPDRDDGPVGLRSA